HRREQPLPIRGGPTGLCCEEPVRVAGKAPDTFGLQHRNPNPALEQRKMSENEFDFDPQTEEGSQPFELVPKGKYTAEVVDAAIVDIKSGRGQMLKLAWVISGGDYDDRRIFQQIIVQHDNEDAMKFGRQRIKDLCDACGIRERVTDVS